MWIPAYVDGKPVEKDFPIKFTLDNNNYQCVYYIEPMIKPLTFICMFYTTICFAYARTTVDTSTYFMKNTGATVSTKDSADFIMLVVSPDSTVDKSLYSIIELYPSGTLKRTSVAKFYNKKLMSDGRYMEYYPNGKRKKMGTLKVGVPIGIETSYFPNGKPYSIKERTDTGMKWIECRDPTGNILTQNGNGKWIELSEDFKDTVARGNVVDKIMDGEWTLVKNEAQYNVKVYKKGKILSSKVINRPGKRAYRPVETEPEFPGGMDAFGKFLGNNVRYPKSALANHSQGLVRVEFNIETDGTLTDIHVEKSVDADLDAEALRVMKLSPKWVPGYTLGKSVKVKYSVPISFTMEN